MNKIITYLRYFQDFIKHGEFRYILTSVRYLLTGKTTRKTRQLTTSLGKFIVREGSLDFQFANYAYEWGVKKFMYENYMNYDVFMDIGANIGTYSVLLAKKGMRGIAFEPVASNFEALSTNLDLNGLKDQVKLYQLALGKYKHEVTFTFDPVNTGASHISDNEINAEVIVGGKDEIVKVVPLDDLIPELGLKKEDRILIKIDVEGMEANVLRGAKKFFETYPNLIITLESVHSGGDNLVKILEEYGTFEFFEIDDLNMAAKRLN